MDSCTVEDPNIQFRFKSICNHFFLSSNVLFRSEDLIGQNQFSAETKLFVSLNGVAYSVRGVRVSRVFRRDASEALGDLMNLSVHVRDHFKLFSPFNNSFNALNCLINGFSHRKLNFFRQQFVIESVLAKTWSQSKICKS